MRTVPNHLPARHPGWTGASEPAADSGFTLVEVMVVLLILAILLAIAIPTFLGVTNGANDKAAQSNLNTALTTAKTYAEQNGQTYGSGGTAPVVTQMLSNEPTLSWVSGATTTQGVISVWVSTDGKGIILASPSKNNSCWYVVDNLAYVAGNATTNGMYIDATASPGVAGSTATAPTRAGTSYGRSTTTSCNAATLVATSGSNVAPVWNTSFATL